MNDEKTNLSTGAVAFLFISALFGAGFASGQEMLKFFCAYNKSGLYGIILSIIIFVIFGFLILKISTVKESGRMEDIISPSDNKKFKKVVSVIIIYCLFLIFVAMLAASSSLFEQQFGLPKEFGGFLMLIIVVATTIIGFKGMARVIPFIIPIMLFFAVLISLIVWKKTIPGASVEFTLYQSPLAANWLISAILYASYNFIAAVPILSTIGQHSHFSKNARWGVVFGALGLGTSAILLYEAILVNIEKASTVDLPMIYLANQISGIFNIIYSIILVIAIYSAAVNSLYGVTKNISAKTLKQRIAIISTIGFIGYVISLIGFSNMVTYLYPTQGYLCIILMISILVSYYRKPQKSKVGHSNTL